MGYYKFCGGLAILLLGAMEVIGQPYPPPAPIIYETYLNGSIRTIREGTHSNRTVDGQNISSPSWNGSTKTNGFWEMTGWDTKFYDGKRNTTGSITAGTNILTVSTVSSSEKSFASSDVGKTIEVYGAGNDSLPLITTIQSFTSSTQVTLADNAVISKSNTPIWYGSKPAYTEGHYTTAWYGNYEMNYRLLFPSGYDPQENYDYPIIVMLHGAGERGNCWGNNCFGNPYDNYSTDNRYRNNDYNLLHGGKPHLDAVYHPTKGSNGKKAEDPTLPSSGWPGFVLFPQNENGWSGYSQYEQAFTIIDLLVSTYNIDPDRIYMHGLSNGAAAVWEVARYRPELFAGILPMSASISNGAEIFNAEVSKAVPIPTWIFQGGKDGNPTPNNTNQIVDKLKAAGGTPRYTIYPNLGHGTWGTAYAEPDFFTWMLSKNKSDIHVFYGDSTICATNGGGVQMGLSQGFLAYQWEKDGAIVTGWTTNKVTATQPGTYRARFSRISATPTENEWNQWSKPVVIKESAAEVPIITSTTSPHFPDINNAASPSVRIEGPTTGNLKKNWYKNGVLFTTATTDTASFIIRNDPGIFTLKTITLDGCPSLFSNPITVTTGTPSTINAPSNLQAEITSPGSVHLFWSDNSNNETGFEIQRSTSPTGPFTFYKLVNEDIVSYHDQSLQPNNTYYYVVRAVSASAVSNYTSLLTVNTGTDTQAPSAPQNLTSPLNSSTISSITLNWEASIDDTGIQKYRISYGGWTIDTPNANTTFTILGLSPNTNYACTVQAIDFNNNVSSSSNQLIVSTVVTGLNYNHFLVIADNLQQINWNDVEFTGHVDFFDISPRVQDDYFDFKFDGYVYITNGGTYQFRTTSDDGSALYLGQVGSATAFTYPNWATNRIVNNDGLHGNVTKTSGNQNLTSGSFYPISVLFFEKTGGQSLTVQYKGPDTGNGWVTMSTSNGLRSGSAPSLPPPATPSSLTATPTGLTSIDLSWDGSPYPNNLNVVVLGSSTAEGTGASTYDSSWVGRLDTWFSNNTTGHTITNLALGGLTTESIRANGSTPTPDTNRNITKALSLNPDIIIVNLPSNNVANGIPIATTMNHYRELKAAADAANVRIIFTTTQPRNFGTNSTYRHLLEEEADSVRNEFGKLVIDIYDSLTDFSNDNRIKAVYNVDDIHVNNAGHAYIFNVALNRLLEQFKAFEIYRSLNNVDFQIVASSGIYEYNDLNLSPSTQYYYKVKAISSSGSSGFSSTVNATTLIDSSSPNAPTNVVVLTNTYTNAGIRWDASTDNVGVTGYKIYANGSLIGDTPYTTHFTTLLTPSTLYNFTVKAYDHSGNESEESSPATITTTDPEAFYSIASADLTQLSSWNSDPDGSGNQPTSFSLNGQYFVIQNPHTLSNPLSIGGSVSKVVINDNVEVNLNQELSGKITAGANAIVNVNYNGSPNFNFSFENNSPTSTVNFNSYSVVPIAKFGNIVLNGTGIKTIPTGTIEIEGNLQTSAGIDIKGSASNGTVIKVNGDIVLGTNGSGISADNYVGLLFTGNKSHILSMANESHFYSLSTEPNALITLNSPTPTTLSLGSLNGGGIELANGSIFEVGNNSIALTGNSTVNRNAETGKISIDNGNISLTTTSSSESNLYFEPIHNKVENLTIESTGGSSIQIQSPLEIYDGIKINNGTLSSNDNITIKSSATASANIREIVYGTITGNVTIERFMAPKGRLYRYLSTPNAGITVANWQTYIPITGNFTGASTGPGLSSNPSMYYYTEPNYLPYPTPGTNNQVPIEVGRGYAVFIREGVSPTTLVTTGNPNQGDISFDSILTGGTASPTDGWNLIGNPYASDIVWSNSGWSSTGIGDVIAVPENLPNNGFQFRYWDRSQAIGTLENGKIPAGQAFWVQSSIATPSLTVTESAKTQETASQNTEFYRSGASEISLVSTFSLELTNGAFIDKTFIKITNEGTDDYVKLNDGEKRPNSYFNLSTLSSDNVALAINNSSNTFCTKTIPVKIDNINAGIYTLRIEIGDFQLANVTIMDSFLNQSIEINGPEEEIEFEVTSEASSYNHRFVILLDRPEISIDNNVISNKENYCSSDLNSFITIEGSQPGVEYEVVNSSFQVISEKLTGNGSDIELTIPISLLDQGTNELRVRGTFSACSSSFMNNVISINLSPTPTISIPSQEISGCVGSSLDISVSGTGSSYQWYDMVKQQPLLTTENNIHIKSLDNYHSYTVKATNDYGCKSTELSVRIRADTLDTPSIVLDEITSSLGTNIKIEENYPSVQWFFNGEKIDGAITNQYHPLEQGLYTIRIDNQFCSKESDSFEFIITGFEEENDQFSLHVYPNPSRSEEASVIGSTILQGELTLRIIDMTGRHKVNKVISYSDFTSGILINEYLPSGSYVVQIIQQGKIRFKKLIIK